MGKTGCVLCDVARAVDNRPIEPFYIRRSTGVDETCPHDLDDPESLSEKLRELADEAYRLELDFPIPY